jgi:hypothetical protein
MRERSTLFETGIRETIKHITPTVGIAKEIGCSYVRGLTFGTAMYLLQGAPNGLRGTINAARLSGRATVERSIIGKINQQ